MHKFGILFLLFLTACAQTTVSPQMVQTAIAETQAVQATSTIAPSPTPMPELTKTSTEMPSGKWVSKKSVSEFTDTNTYTLLLEADTPIKAWLDEPTPTLIIRCKEKMLDSYIHLGTTPDIEHGTDLSTVRLRFGNGEPFELKMSPSTDNEALFFPNPDEAIKQFLKNDKMTFGFTPFNAAPVATTFNLDGLQNKISPLLSECNSDISIDQITPTEKIHPPDNQVAVSPIKISGKGQNASDLFSLEKGLYKVYWETTGEYGFMFYIKDGSSEYSELITSDPGQKTGQAFVKLPSSNKFFLQMETSDGDWTVTFEPQ